MILRRPTYSDGEDTYNSFQYDAFTTNMYDMTEWLRDNNALNQIVPMTKLIKCKCYLHPDDDGYVTLTTKPATGILYITKNSPYFISGHIRARGKDNGKYPYGYLEMIDRIFGSNDNTIEVCSGNSRYENTFTVDINPANKPDIVDDAQLLEKIPDNTFSRWRCDPPYNCYTAQRMYGTSLPVTGKLLKTGARVCNVGSLLFLLLGPQNYQRCPPGVKRIGWVAITIVPNNELRALNIFYKYANS